MEWISSSSSTTATSSREGTSVATSPSAPVTWWSFLKKGCLATRSVLVAVALVGVPAGSAGAADWSLKALFSETALYEDNRSLAPVPPGADYALTTSLSLDLMARTPTCEFHLKPDFNYPYYFGPGAAGLTNEFRWSGAVTFSKKVSRTTQFNLMASITPASTKTTELTDSGETTLDATRWTTTYGGTISHQVSALDSVSLSATSTSVRFTGASGNLIPFSSNALSGIVGSIASPG